MSAACLLALHNNGPGCPAGTSPSRPRQQHGTHAALPSQLTGHELALLEPEDGAEGAGEVDALNARVRHLQQARAEEWTEE